MVEKNNPPSLTSFDFGEGDENVVFVETVDVIEGVKCDVYSVEGNNSKDLGIIKIELGHKTPLQKVLKGDQTIEGHVSGKGLLQIIRASGDEEIYPVDEGINEHFSVDVGIGDTMQWQADENANLKAFEICIPPYEEGRYENLK